MRIWELDSERNGGYETLFLANRKVDLPSRGNLMKTVENWGKIELLNHHKGKPSDIPDFSSVKPVFSRKNVDSVKDLLEGRAQILQIIHSQRELYIINVHHVIRCH